MGPLTGPVVAAGVLVFLFGLVLFIGIHYGLQKARAQLAEERAEAIRDKKSLDDEIDSLGPDALDDRFNRWMRDR